MKKILAFFVLIVLASCQKKNENTVNTSSDPIATDTVAARPTLQQTNPVDDIVWIKQKFGEINAQKLEQKSFTFACEVENTITYHLHQGNVVKITIQWGFLGDGETYTEYYYDQGTLFFIYERYLGGPAGLEPTTHEVRKYIKENSVVRLMENQKVVACTENCSITSNSQPLEALKAYEDRAFAKRLCRME